LDDDVDTGPLLLLLLLLVALLFLLYAAAIFDKWFGGSGGIPDCFSAPGVGTGNLCVEVDP
jgi:hypothetical protein